MRTKLTGLVFAAMLLAADSGTIGQPKRQADIDLQAAIRTETVMGDLKGALKQYENLIAKYGKDRPVAATALVHMAECYEKLGDTQAQKIYERVVRDYADQKEAVFVARARLGRNESAQQAGAMSSRQVWTLPRAAFIYATVSHDGRYLPYTDWASGRGVLFLHDMASGANRQITNDVEKLSDGYVGDGGTFSPDDTQFAYSWHKDPPELRVIGLQAPGVSHPRVLFSNSEVPRIWTQDWSADGKWLAVQLQRKDKTAQIGLVAVQDGSLRVLKSVDWRGVSKLFFSPDNKYLAYDLPTTDTGDRRDVFVLATDGSREMPAVVHPGDDVLMGWSPDGKRLLFTSDRTGSTGLWSLAFMDGKPQGTPEQIKVDFTGASMGLTSKGALYSFTHHSSFTGVIRSDIQTAAFDFAKGQFLSTPTSVVQTFVGANNFPAWSPDGKYLAFLSRRGIMAQGTWSTVITILSLGTGQLRELRPQLNIHSSGPGLRWSPDGLSLAIRATDSKGRQGVFRINTATGEATSVALSSEGEALLGAIWAPDGKRMYYSRRNWAGQFTVLVERDLSSGSEKEVIRKSGGTPYWIDRDLSPDGKYFAAVDGDWFAGPPASPGRTRKWNVVLIPASGGEPKELMRGESQGAGVLMWAPDSRSIFVYSIKDKGWWQGARTDDREVWRVAIDGTEPQKLDLNVNFLGPLGNSDQQLHAHPDGKRVVFAAAEPAKPEEVWALENFLPALNKSK